jgi:hypothetical protein
MKRNIFDQRHLRHLVCLLVIVLGFCFSISIVYGQRTEITADEYNEIMKKVGDKTSTFSYRLIVETTSYSKVSGQVHLTKRSVNENVPSGDFRLFNEFEDHFLNKTWTIELTKVKGIEYRRTNKENWKIFDSITKLGGKNIDLERKTIKYFLTKNFNFNGQIVDVVELQEEYFETSPYPKDNKLTETLTYRSRKSVIKDGVWLSMEMMNEEGSEKRVVFRGSWKYEYDPSIRVDAPSN